MKDIIILANARRPVPERVSPAAVVTRATAAPAPLRRDGVGGGLAGRWKQDATTGGRECRRSRREAAAEADAGIVRQTGSTDRRAIFRNTGSGCRKAA